MLDARIAFIGCGNIARNLIGGLIDNGYDPHLIQAADPDQQQQERGAQDFGIVVGADNQLMVENADIVVFAVKPQVLDSTLLPLKALFSGQNRLAISVAAGVRLHYLSRLLSTATPIVRVMPNTPSLVQCGAAGMIANTAVNEQQKAIAELIFAAVGVVVWLEEEAAMDIVTALSGSGPAYYFLVMEVMEQAASAMGLPLDQARTLTLATALGAAKMATQSDLTPALLRKQVSASGGTTERAINTLLSGGVSDLFKTALIAAKERAEELAQSIEDDG